MTYRPEIDGLRALAVIPVVLFHAGFDTFSGGYVGVDVFFVISGFLITSIIIHELHAGTFSLINFYERRARRILPALTLMLSVSSIFAFILLWPIELHEFSKSLRYVVAFCSNIFFDKNIGYFDTASELQPLLHTWSLAIEEQYYIILPAALMLAWRYEKSTIFIALGAIALVSLAYCEYKSHVKFDNSFFLLRARIWELVVVSLVAFTCAYRLHHALHAPILKQLLSALGLIAIALAVFTFDKKTPFPGLFALLPTVGTALVILFATRQNLVGRLLGLKALVAVGLISYSLYLWHYPIFVFARHALGHEPEQHVYAGLMLLTFVLATLSYSLVELPFRRGMKISTKRIGLLSIGSTIPLLFFAIAGDKTRGFEEFYFANRATPEIRKVHETISTQDFNHVAAPDYENCIFSIKSQTENIQTRFDDCVQKFGPAIIIMGDSHAADIFRSLYSAKLTPFMVGMTKGACPIVHAANKQCFYEPYEAFFAKNKPNIKQIIYHQAGFYLFEDGNNKHFKNKQIASFDPAIANISVINATLRYLEGFHKIIPVTWIGPFPDADRNMKNYNNFANGYTMNPSSLDKFQQLEQMILEEYKRTNFSVNYIPFSQLMTIDQNFLKVGNCITYRDTNHFSSCGEKIVGSKIKNNLQKLLSKYN